MSLSPFTSVVLQLSHFPTFPLSHTAIAEDGGTRQLVLVGACGNQLIASCGKPQCFPVENAYLLNVKKLDATSASVSFHCSIAIVLFNTVKHQLDFANNTISTYAYWTNADQHHDYYTFEVPFCSPWQTFRYRYISISRERCTRQNIRGVSIPPETLSCHPHQPIRRLLAHDKI